MFRIVMGSLYDMVSMGGVVWSPGVKNPTNQVTTETPAEGQKQSKICVASPNLKKSHRLEANPPHDHKYTVQHLKQTNKMKTELKRTNWQMTTTSAQKTRIFEKFLFCFPHCVSVNFKDVRHYGLYHWWSEQHQFPSVHRLLVEHTSLTNEVRPTEENTGCQRYVHRLLF